MAQNWTVDDVCKWLNDVGLNQYVTDFKINKISGQVLPLLKESHLKEMGITKIGHRLLVMKAVNEIRSGTFGQGGGGSAPEEDLEPPKRNVPPPSPPASSEQSAVRRSAPKPQTSGGGSSVRDSGSYDTPPPAKRMPGQRPQFTSEKVKQQKAAADAPPPAAAPKPKPKASPAKAAGGSNQLRQSLRRNAPPPSAADDGDDDRVACSYCGRKFASDRIAKHEEVCARMSHKKTKVFDSTKMRTQGTEAAAFVRKGKKNEPVIKKDVNGVPKYKLEHQRLVESMRAARKLQAYEKAKAEGKAVGPPPEMPAFEMPDDDRVQCPYCGRKFAEEAARRHIPVCERQNAGRAPLSKSRGRGRR